MYLLHVFQIYTAFTLAYIWFGIQKKGKKRLEKVKGKKKSKKRF